MKTYFTFTVLRRRDNGTRGRRLSQTCCWLLPLLLGFFATESATAQIVQFSAELPAGYPASGRTVGWGGFDLTAEQNQVGATTVTFPMPVPVRPVLPLAVQPSRLAVCTDFSNAHNLVIRSDGTVLAWGFNSRGQTNVPAGLVGVSSVSTGSSTTSYAVMANGSVAQWGSGSSSVPSGLANIASIKVGWNGNTLALKSDGTLVQWGGGPTIPAGLNNIVSIAAGDDYFLALKSDGTVTGWATSGGSFPPTTIPVGLSNVVAISAGGMVSAALKSNGELVMWGRDAANTSLPAVPAAAQTGVVAISAMPQGVVALKNDGSVLVITDETIAGLSSVPFNATNVIAVAGGQNHIIALRADGKMIAWGSNKGGCGIIPEGIDGIVSIASTNYGSVPIAICHSLALRADGTVFGWGGNVRGQASAPVGMSSVVQIAAGVGFSIALKADGTVTGWGTSVSVPAGLSGITQIAAGESHGLALRSNGTVVAWGSGGAVSVPSGLSGVTRISAGPTHSAARKSDGTVVAWGGSFMTPPVGFSNVADIASGADFILGLKADGSTVSWVPSGLGTFPPLSGVAQISAGGYWGVAKSSSGLLQAFQVGPGNNSLSPIPSNLEPLTRFQVCGGGFAVAYVGPPSAQTVGLGSQISRPIESPIGTNPLIMRMNGDSTVRAAYIPGIGSGGDGSLFATGVGQLFVYWPKALGGYVQQTYQVTDTASKTIVHLYHTHTSAQNLGTPSGPETANVPRVFLPPGKSLVAVWNDALPLPTPGDPYFAYGTDGGLLAKQRTGRCVGFVFNDTDGDRVFDAGETYLGMEVIEIRSFDPAAGDPSTTVNYAEDFQRQITPDHGATPAFAREVLKSGSPSGYVSIVPPASGSPITVRKDASNRLTGIRAVVPASGMIVPWRLTGPGDIEWPHERHSYQVAFPDTGNVMLMARGTPGNPGSGIVYPAGVNPTVVYAVALADDSPLTENVHFSINGGQITTTIPAKIVLMFNPDGIPDNGDETYQAVLALDHGDSRLYDSVVANHPIGSEIVPPQGSIYGKVYSGQKFADYLPGGLVRVYGESRQIIPVNLDSLEVWWHTEFIVPNSGIAGQEKKIEFPSMVRRYNTVWPDIPASGPLPNGANQLKIGKIVIASEQGSGAIDPAIYKNPGIYYQNSSAQPGFNPNDEHAAVFAAPGSQGSSAIFALRDDFARPTTSEPYVLMHYREPTDTDLNKRYRFKVFRVVAEDAAQGFTFSYSGEAGKPIQPLYPLTLLRPSAPQNKGDGVSGPYFEDRKGDLWARAAADNGGAAVINADWYYLNQPSFYYPPLAHSYTGTVEVPFLDNDTLNPRDVAYTVTWPTVPTLLMGETLVRPKHGLPGIEGQDSVQVIYEQARHLDGTGTKDNVKLIDFKKEIKVKLSDYGQLAAIPSDVASVQDGAVRKFGNLTPSLAQRLYYNPTENELRYKGTLVVPDIGQTWVLPNVITPLERAVLLDVKFRGGDVRFLNALTALCDAAATVKEIPAGDYVINPATAIGFDSMAVTAGYAEAEGYVTLIMNNDPDLSSPATPVSVEIIRVTAPLYRGTLQVIEPESLFDEKLTLMFDGDLAGLSNQYEFEWKKVAASVLSEVADQNNLAVTDDAVLPGSTIYGSGNGPWNSYQLGTGKNSGSIEGPGLETLTDNFFTCRYRPLNAGHPLYNGGQGWSQWTPPQIGEGWIKRVLSGLNPFEQRFSDLSSPTRTVDTRVSMLSLAGARWEGNVPFTEQGAMNSGLIEAYETILNRGIDFSIEGLPALDNPDANNALLLAAGRLADLYMLLGNEANADAADPTLSVGTQFSSSVGSVHAFMQIAGGGSLLEEELSLLRGRDDLMAPGVQNPPVYARLLWNFTGDRGETAYANNYGIRDSNNSGGIDESDAKKDYPQGHGDAWGHYLTAAKNYYRLLRNANFTWQKRSEQILLGGVPVEVDYMDERRFAKAAAARAQSGAEITALTYRDRYKEDSAQQWQGYKDTQTYFDGSKRAWGVDEWGCRTGQGGYLDWVVGNALLPANDAAHTGIQKIDRTTVTELRDLASSLAKVQTEVDKADSGLNPLGLVKHALPLYELTSADVDAGTTLFEKAYQRSITVLNNALAVFNRADGASQELRSQGDTLTQFQTTVDEKEMDFRNRLIEVFGYPYSSDIGGGQTYPAGYSGPDLYHYMYVDPSELTGVDQKNLATETVGVRLMDYGLDKDKNSDFIDDNGVASPMEKVVTFHLSTQGYGFIKPSAWTGTRQAQGQLQVAHSEILQARSRLDRAITEYDNHLKQIEDRMELLQAQKDVNASEISIQNATLGTQESLNDVIRSSRRRQTNFRTLGRIASAMSNAVAEGLPTNLIVIAGLAAGGGGDFMAPGRAAIRTIGTLVDQAMSVAADYESLIELGHQQAKERVQSQTSITLSILRNDFTIQQEVKQIEALMRQEASVRLEVYTSKEVMIQAAERYKSLLAQGQRLLEERLVFRQKTAANVQSMRYKDMAFRIFRNDALEKYRAQFDMAAAWVYMAARAYDFDTNWSGDGSEPPGVLPGMEFLESIVKARAIGEIGNGQPITSQNGGDGGLADPMARMKQNWDNLKGPLGYNQPQNESIQFSMRKELLRIPSGAKSDKDWREALQRYVVPDVRLLPEFVRYCIPPSGTSVEPAIVLPFATTVEDGMNFFAWPLAGGDSAYSSTVSATKIQKLGVWFSNYNNSSLGLSSTPRVYLIPVGADIMRSPMVTSTREWRVVEQVIPTPFALSASYVNSLPGAWVPALDPNSFLGNEADIRRFADFRAFHDGGTFNASQLTTSSRLIGRSVWNTRWLLVIRGRALLSNPDEALQRFINGALVSGQRDGQGIKDILLNFQTYAIQGF